MKDPEPKIFHIPSTGQNTHFSTRWHWFNYKFKMKLIVVVVWCVGGSGMVVVVKELLICEVTMLRGRSALMNDEGK